MGVSPYLTLHPLTVARKGRRMTLFDVATVCGWSTSLQGQYEIGMRAPDPDRLKKLAELFELDPVVLGSEISKWMKGRERALQTVA